MKHLSIVESLQTDWTCSMVEVIEACITQHCMTTRMQSPPHLSLLTHHTLKPLPSSSNLCSQSTNLLQNCSQRKLIKRMDTAFKQGSLLSQNKF